MNDNIINIAKSPILDSIKDTCSTFDTEAICGDLAKSLKVIKTIKPKDLTITDVTKDVLNSCKEVIQLPCHRVIYSMHSVNSAKTLYLIFSPLPLGSGYLLLKKYGNYIFLVQFQSIRNNINLPY